MSQPVLIVFSHLRWGFVFQRPQHLLSRLAGRWRVVFVEEPHRCEGPARLEPREVAPGLTVVVPHTPAAAFGFHDDQLALLQPLLTSYLDEQGLQPDIAWLYTPMALPLVKTVAPTCVVYDCMDELSAFKHAPRQLRQRESALLKQADLVLAGGPSLYEARRDKHANVHCLPSAVDAAHFAPANRDPACAHAEQTLALQDNLPHPRLGFFGVIDERLDLSLVSSVADAHPEWTVVMVGPVVKIDPASLPQRPNIHWLGMQSYERLPHLLAGWDLCLMPFAINESTQFISPTKTLEYMAAEKPVVSTPVRDVVSLYGEAVRLADGGPAFVQACEAMLAETATERARRATVMRAAVSRYSWDRTANTVHTLMAASLKRAQGALRTPAMAPLSPLTSVTEMAVPRVAAGAAGA